MDTCSRRSFLHKSVAGAVAAGSLFLPGSRSPIAKTKSTGRVTLGNTGIDVSRIAMGTGTSGGRHHSNQTKLGMKSFTDLANHAYDRGITFLETADMYGSHVYIREALKQIPRDKVVILTKMWIRPNNWMKTMTASEFLRMFTSFHWFSSSMYPS